MTPDGSAFRPRTVLRLLPALLLAGCSGPQSALDPAGREAETLYDLLLVMTIGGVAIWLGVIALALYAGNGRREVHHERSAIRLVIWGGVAFPVVVLTALLCYALWLMPDLRPWTRAEAEPGTLAGHVTGEQFWWRVRYDTPAGPVESANEMIVPVGRAVNLTLSSPDVIHSFWVPALAGKMDVIPGRVNRITLTATRPGVYRGACAEFCGESHALMAFTVRALAPEEHAAALAAEAAPAAIGAGGAAAEGLALFLKNGCNACHAIRGTEATGRIGPDLTHVGSRSTLAAATLANDQPSRERFLREPDAVKPGIEMPGYAMLADAEIETLARFLGDLK